MRQERVYVNKIYAPFLFARTYSPLCQWRKIKYENNNDVFTAK